MSTHGESALLLAELVRIPSQNPMGRRDASPAGGFFEGRLTDFLAGWLAERGIGCERHRVDAGRENLIARVEPPGARHTLLFDVHQDTVPADGMTIDPFAAWIEDGRLEGRGACDVKGSLAAMLLAVERLARERPRGAAAVVLACTVDEEYTHTGSSALAAWAAEQPIDLAVVAEPTRFEVVTSHKGAVRWAIEARGTACHSSMPGLGDNAIYRMARVVRALEAHAEELLDGPGDRILGAPTLSVGTIAGGVTANIVPDGCRIEIDRRVVPGETPESARERVREALGRWLDPEDYRNLAFEPPWVQMPALTPSVAGPVVEAIREVVKNVAGRLTGVGGVPFGTDAGPLGEAGLSCVVMGPGDIAQAHTRDEWIDLTEVAAAVEIYYELALRLPSCLGTPRGRTGPVAGVRQ